MFSINSQIKCGLYISGKEFLLDSGNLLQSIHINASSLTKLPVLCIKFSDALNLMQNFDIGDGTPISLVINGTFNTRRNFRIGHFERHPLPSGFVYTLNCYWDSPKYWVGTDNAAIQGTSSSVLSTIASMCGLEVNSTNTSTSDSMLWMQGNKSYSSFARDIARHGYVADSSLMMLAVDSIGKLRYMDINALPAPVVTVGYTPPPDQTQFLLMKDFKPVTKSGVSNAIGGYRHDRYVQSADSSSPIPDLQSSIQLSSDSQLPLLNSDVRSEMNRGGISYSPIDFGNVHDNYERAFYQNIRYNLLKSLTGEFLFPFQTAFEPGSQFTFSQTPEINSPEYNGVYTVQTKIIFAQGSEYNEKIVAVKNGLSS